MQAFGSDRGMFGVSVHLLNTGFVGQKRGVSTIGGVPFLITVFVSCLVSRYIQYQSTFWWVKHFTFSGSSTFVEHSKLTQCLRCRLKHLH